MSKRRVSFSTVILGAFLSFLAMSTSATAAPVDPGFDLSGRYRVVNVSCLGAGDSERSPEAYWTGTMTLNRAKVVAGVGALYRVAYSGITPFERMYVLPELTTVGSDAAPFTHGTQFFKSELKSENDIPELVMNVGLIMPDLVLATIVKVTAENTRTNGRDLSACVVGEIEVVTYEKVKSVGRTQ